MSSEPSVIPEIPQAWIYIMMTFGWIGVVVHLLIICLSVHFSRKKKHSTLSKFQILLNLIIWICNFIACLEWGTLRTSVFFELNVARCKFNYISNYLFYMMGKYTLQILLFYRLFFVFRATNIKFKRHYAYIICSVITINFIIFTVLWFLTAMDHVTVGVLVPNRSISICTMFNSSKESVHGIDRIWPILLGGQDLIVGLFTLTLFSYKITQFHRDPKRSLCNLRKVQIGKVMIMLRKLLVLGTISITSTFIFYTFAIPFYGNLTFLLPFDATVNSLCTVLLFSYSSPMYNILCLPCDIFVQLIFGAPKIEQELREVRVKKHTSVNTRTNTLDAYHLHHTTVLSTTAKSESDVRKQKCKIPPILPKRAASLRKELQYIKSQIIGSGTEATEIMSNSPNSPNWPMPLADSRHAQSSFF